MAVNRFYQRQLRNQYVPATMQEMSMLPESRINMQAQAHTTLNQLQPLFNVRNADAAEASKNVNEFESRIDQLRNNLMQHGSIDPTVQQELSELTQQYQDFNAPGGKWAMYQKSYNDYQSELETYNDLIKKGKNVGWWESQRNLFQSVNNKPSFDDQGNYQGVQSVPKANYWDETTELMTAFGKVDLDTLSYDTPQVRQQFAQLGIQPTQGEDGRLEYRSEHKMLLVANALAGSREVQEYYQMEEMLTGVPSGLFSDDPEEQWFTVDANGAPKINTETKYGAAVSQIIAAKATVRQKGGSGDATNTYRIGDGSNIIVTASGTTAPYDHDLNGLQSVNRLVADNTTMLLNATEKYDNLMVSTLGILGVSDMEPYGEEVVSAIDASIDQKTYAFDQDAFVTEIRSITDANGDPVFTEEQINKMQKQFVPENRDRVYTMFADVSTAKNEKRLVQADLDYYNQRLTELKDEIYADNPELKSRHKNLSLGLKILNSELFPYTSAHLASKLATQSMSPGNTGIALVQDILPNDLVDAMGTTFFEGTAYELVTPNSMKKFLAEKDGMKNFSAFLASDMANSTDLFELVQNGIFTEKDVFNYVQNAAHRFYGDSDMARMATLSAVSYLYDKDNAENFSDTGNDAMNAFEHYYEDMVAAGIDLNSLAVKRQPTILRVSHKGQVGILTEQTLKDNDRFEKDISLAPTAYMVDLDDRTLNIPQFLAEQNEGADAEDIVITNASDIGLALTGDGKRDSFSVTVEYTVDGKKGQTQNVLVRP